MTLKEKKFVKITAQTLNPAQAVRETYQLGSKGGSKTKKQKDKVISAIAKENLGKPRIKKALLEVMEDKGIDNDLISTITKRNLKQKGNYPASNQVLDMLHKLKGSYAPEKRVNININPDNIDNLLKAQQDELNLIQQEAKDIQ